MKKSVKTVKIAAYGILLLAMLVFAISLAGCADAATGSYGDTQNTKVAADRLQTNQPTPTDIEYSLERYNLTRRAYWVNGQREKANALPCPITKPLGYVILLTESGSVVGRDSPWTAKFPASTAS